jgi:hypothetical protein
MKQHSEHLLREAGMSVEDFQSFWKRAHKRWDKNRSRVWNLESYLQAEVSVQKCQLAGTDPFSLCTYSDSYEGEIAVMNDMGIECIPQAREIAKAIMGNRGWIG